MSTVHVACRTACLLVTMLPVQGLWAAEGSLPAPSPAAVAEVGQTTGGAGGTPEPAVTQAPAPKLPEWLERTTVQGRTYLRYSYNPGSLDPAGEVQADKGANELKIDRIYLQFDFRVGQRGRVHYTLEGGDLRETAYKLETTVGETGGLASASLKESLGAFDVVTKSFYLEVADLFYKSGYLQIGQLNTPWVSYADGVSGYRLQGTVLADRFGYLTSTDLGLTLGGKIPRGMGSWQVSVVNGEGWKSPELFKAKDLQARLTVNPLGFSKGPLSGLFLTGFYARGQYDDILKADDPEDEVAPAAGKQRIIAQAGFKLPGKLTVAGEYLRATDPTAKLKSRYLSLSDRTVPEGGSASELESLGSGYSAMLVLNPGLFTRSALAQRFELVVRKDHLVPDQEISSSADLFVAGVSYRWSKQVQTLVDFESLSYGGDEYEARAAAGKYDERRFLVQTEARF